MGSAAGRNALSLLHRIAMVQFACRVRQVLAMAAIEQRMRESLLDGLPRIFSSIIRRC